MISKARPFVFLVFLLFGGCAAIGVYDGDRRILGRIDAAKTAWRPPHERSPNLFPLGGGLLGALIDHGINSTSERVIETRSYSVKTALGDVFLVQTDDTFAVGECVEVIPRKGAHTEKFYTDEQARVVRSAACR